MKLAMVLACLLLLVGCVVFIAWPRPQDPRERAYAIKQVQFAGGDGVTLAGELTMPLAGGPFTAVILLSGSGPSDRDETVAGHRPSLVLSDHLTKAGYAVLRYDDRGVGQSSGNFDTATLSDFAEDAVGAFEWLGNQQNIDAARIGFVGASEGGFKAPLAAQSVPAAFLVFLGGPAKPLLPDVKGVNEVIIAKARRQYEVATKILAGGGTVADIRDRLDAYLASEGQTARQRRATLDMWATPWGIDMRSPSLFSMYRFSLGFLLFSSEILASSSSLQT